MARRPFLRRPRRFILEGAGKSGGWIYRPLRLAMKSDNARSNGVRVLMGT